VNLNRSLWPVSPQEEIDGISPSSSNLVSGAPVASADSLELQRLREEVEALRSELRAARALPLPPEKKDAEKELGTAQSSTAPGSRASESISRYGDGISSFSSDIHVDKDCPISDATSPASAGAGSDASSMPTKLQGDAMNGTSLPVRKDWRLREKAYRWARGYFSKHGRAGKSNDTFGALYNSQLLGLGGGQVRKQAFIAEMRNYDAEVAAFFESPSQNFRDLLFQGDDDTHVAWDDFVDCYVKKSRPKQVPSLQMTSSRPQIDVEPWAGGVSPAVSSRSNSSRGVWLQNSAGRTSRAGLFDISPSTKKDSLLVSMSSCAEEGHIGSNGTPWTTQMEDWGTRTVSPGTGPPSDGWATSPRESACAMPLQPAGIRATPGEASSLNDSNSPAISPTASCCSGGVSPPPRRQRLAKWNSTNRRAPSPPSSPPEEYDPPVLRSARRKGPEPGFIFGSLTGSEPRMHEASMLSTDVLPEPPAAPPHPTSTEMMLPASVDAPAELPARREAKPAPPVTRYPGFGFSSAEATAGRVPERSQSRPRSPRGGAPGTLLVAGRDSSFAEPCLQGPSSASRDDLVMRGEHRQTPPEDLAEIAGASTSQSAALRPDGQATVLSCRTARSSTDSSRHARPPLRVPVSPRGGSLADGGRRSRSASPTPKSMPMRLTCGPAKYDGSPLHSVRSQPKIITGCSSRTSSRDSSATLDPPGAQARLSSQEQPQTQRSQSRPAEGPVQRIPSAGSSTQRYSPTVPVPAVAVKPLQPSARMVASWVPPQGCPAVFCAPGNTSIGAVTIPSPRTPNLSPRLSLAAPPAPQFGCPCFSFGAPPAPPVSFQPPRLLLAEPSYRARSASPFPTAPQGLAHVQASMRSATPPPCAASCGTGRPVARPSLASFAGLSVAAPRGGGQRFPGPPVWNVAEISPVMSPRASVGLISSV